MMSSFRRWVQASTSLVFLSRRTTYSSTVRISLSNLSLVLCTCGEIAVTAQRYYIGFRGSAVAQTYHLSRPNFLHIFRLGPEKARRLIAASRIFLILQNPCSLPWRWHSKNAWVKQLTGTGMLSNCQSRSKFWHKPPCIALDLLGYLVTPCGSLYAWYKDEEEGKSGKERWM
jgi:hypothetical protein